MGAEVHKETANPRYEILKNVCERPTILVCRARRLQSGERVILKILRSEAAGKENQDRFRREFGILSKVDIPGVVRAYGLEESSCGLMMVLEDIGGESLQRLASGTALPVAQFLDLAIGLAATLAALHHLQIVHNAVCPAHIVLNSETGQFRLIGFGMAHELPHLTVTAQSPADMKGNLAYVSPEQTGRMNRSVDYRTDFYSLGATFYQLLTGRLPFVAEDDLGLIHCHIAIQPLPPSRCAAGIPEPLSTIVMKLLAKTTEERYQTALGLKADLERCATQWEEQGRIAPFPLGARDIPDRLLIPGKLYGREREVEVLLTAFDQVVKSGKTGLVLVSGYSGVGKSAVVNELHKALIPPRGLFTSAKFDQYKRGIPYATLTQAFGRLIDPLLGKSEAELEGWRQAFQQALDPIGQLIADLVPEIKLIIGEQPPVPELEPSQAKARFQLVFRRFIGVFARPEHPLVLFIDDLQWLDAATLDLIEDLLTQEGVRHLLLIGAYRDNEVGPDHQLMRKLKSIREAGAAVQEITLAPLALADVTQLIADSLHCAPESAALPARLVHEKTAGNPFFTIQFLSALAQEGSVAFDHDEGRWSWDLSRIEAKGYADNVADLMAGKLTRLPGTTRNALQQLACLGNVAQASTLSVVLETPEEEVQAALQEALRQDLVQKPNSFYRFVHDRVQEAAYALIPASSRAEAHLKIGRALLAHTPQEQREEAVFEIVSQLNRGAALITSQDEREELAHLNLIAGKRAKASSAYASALTYLTAGTALLAEDSWEHRHELTFALELLRAECEFLSGKPAVAGERLATLSTRTATTVERAMVACLCVDLSVTVDQSGRAVAVGLDYLRHLGIEWPPHPMEEEVRREYERIWAQLGSRSIEDLIELPLMTDPATLATVDVLIKLAPAALFTDANLYALAVCRAVNLSLERGNGDASCVAYEWVGGMVAGARFGDYKSGFRFAQLGLALVERRGLERFQARTYMNFGGVVAPWTKHVRAGRDLLRRAFALANKTGDLTYAAYTCVHLNSNMLAAGDPLVEVHGEAENALEFAQRLQFGLVVDRIAPQLALIRTLRGLMPKFGSFDDEQWSEIRFERHLSGNPALALAECWYWIRKLQARFFAGDYASAIDASARAQQLLWTSPAFLETAEYHFYAALSHAACCDSAEPSQGQQHLEALAVHHKQLEIWAENCPENFENRAALVNAEIARIEHRDQDAMRLYERAIASARENGFVQNEALAYELAAGFYRQRGFDRIARAYLTEAATCYTRWGAEGKVRQLEHLHPWLKQTREPEGTLAERLDALSVAKAQQAISGEMLLDSLARTLLRIVMENAGAQSGYLAVEGYDELRAVMQYGQEGAPHIVFDTSPTGQNLPAAILNYVRRTREMVVLSDAGSDAGQFSADEYLLRIRPTSILCMAIERKDRLLGILYLENNLATGAFTLERRIVLEMLASQAAISLETAGVHVALKASESRYRQIVATANEGIWVVGPDNLTTFVNPRLVDLLGCAAEEMLGRPLTDFMFAEDVPDHNQKMERCRQGLSEHYERCLRRKDGQTLWTLVSATPNFGEHHQYQGSFAMVTDITDRKRAEAALRESEAYLAEGQRLSHTGSWAFDVASNKYVYVSEECVRMFELDSQEDSRTREAVSRLIHPEDWPRVNEGYEKSVREKVDTASEFRIALPSGTVKHVHAIRHPVLNDAGEVVQVVGTVMDVTERKRAEEQRDRLRQLEAELSHIHRVSMMGELTASIAHEVNQPLSGVVSNAGASLRWLAGDPPNLEKAREATSRIVRDGKRAAEVIARVRGLATRAAPPREKLDLNETLREVLALVGDEAKRKSVIIQAQMAGDLSPVSGDRVQLQQVVLNLIMNGIEAMSSVEGRTRELTITTHNIEPDQVQLTVDDAGIGLDPTMIDKIFEPFYTTKSGGMGMGLSICRSILQSHGGRLCATPNPTHGATFQFTLPVLAADAPVG